MNIVEFAENCLKLKLTKYQKELLWAYHNRGPSGNFISIPVRSGKTMIAKIIAEYEKGVYDVQRID